jgi:hypothetical protein
VYQKLKTKRERKDFFFEVKQSCLHVHRTLQVNKCKVSNITSQLGKE